MQPIFALDNVIADDVVPRLCQCCHALMQSAEHGGSHGIPGKCAIPHLLNGEGVRVQKQVKRKADKGNLKLLLRRQRESRFPCTGWAVDNNDFAESIRVVPNLICLKLFYKIFFALHKPQASFFQ